jgi:hypothetical protein
VSKPDVKPYDELEGEALRALASKTLRTADAPPEHVEAAIRRLAAGSTTTADLIARFTAREVRQLRAFLESVVERERAERSNAELAE